MGRGINLSHIGHALQTDGDDGLPNRGSGLLDGGETTEGGLAPACAATSGAAASGPGLRVCRRQAGSKFVQFSIADRRVSRQSQHGANLKRLTLSGDYPT
jgi:hypothetical protein